MGPTPTPGMGTLWHSETPTKEKIVTWYVDKGFPYNVSRNQNGSSTQVVCQSLPEAKIMHFEKMEVEYLLRGKEKKAKRCAEQIKWWQDNFAEELI